MDSNKYLITVSGPPAAGTSSLCSGIAEETESKVISGGQIFREIAREKSIKPHELSNIAEDDSGEIDRMIDDKLRNIISDYSNNQYDKQKLVIDSRLAGWHAKNICDDYLSIWLKAPRSVRASRIKCRDETIEELRKREISDKRRYRQYYNIDIDDLSIYDLVIDTDMFETDEVTSLCIQAMESCLDSSIKRKTI